MEEAQRPLPYMYGSPEYLQVCSLHLIKHVVGITTCCCVMVKVLYPTCTSAIAGGLGHLNA